MNPERRPEYERQPQQPGIDVICGPMFSGKSSELINLLKRLPHAGYEVEAFYPEADDRRGEGTINSEDGAEYPATPVKTSREILEKVKPGVQIVGIDEAQFFDMELTVVCMELARSGRRVVVAGLDKDFKGEPFGPMGELKLEADNVESKVAFCKKCGGAASFTQRIVNDEPAHYEEEVVVVGATELYEARCRSHHEVPGKPIRKLE